MSLFDRFTDSQKGQQNVAKAASEKPENTKQQSHRQHTQGNAGNKAFDQLPEEQRKQVDEVKARLEQATKHLSHDASASTPSPSDGANSPEAMRQKMSGQEKTAPDLSPTSMQKGQAAGEKSVSAPADQTPTQTQSATPSRPLQAPSQNLPSRSR